MCGLKKYILYCDFIFGDVKQKDLLFGSNASPKGHLSDGGVAQSQSTCGAHTGPAWVPFLAWGWRDRD